MEMHPRDDRAPDPPRRGLPRGVWWAIALAIVVLAVAALKATSTGGSSAGSAVLDPTATEPTNPLLPGPSAVGRPITTDALDRLDGTETSFADHHGTPMVVNFWSSSCAPCVTEMPDLEAVHQEYGDRVAFIGVDVRDGVGSGQAMADRTGVSYELVRDPDGKVIASVG